MSNEIIININEANKAQKYKDPKEYFQREAYTDVTKILKEHSVDTQCDDITNCRFHDTIFIDGDRGVGKTAFMVNIEKYYNDNRDKEKDKKYIFLNPIDPTLLEHTEKFLTIVLAKIVEMVNIRFENNCFNQNKSYDNCDNQNSNTYLNENCKDSYFKSLEKLSESLSAIKTMEEDRGIEEIASSKSSLKLEQHAHNFFKIICQMLNVDSLVMLIDDVDMAFDKGFDVLEVVRKYLASPYLIPIVAGDMKLYKEIVETQFMSKINYQSDLRALNDAQKICNDTNDYYCNVYKKKKELLNKLVEQYLTKIFPNEYHIKLKNIFTIIKENEVIVKFNDKLKVPFTEIKDFEIRFINLGINQTKFTYQVFSDNTRDLVQYLYSKRDIYIEIFGNKKYFSGDFEFNKSHQKYTPQNVMDRYDDTIMNFISDVKGLNKKSQEITSLFYEYHEGKQRELSLLTNNDVKAYENGSYNIYKAFSGDVFKDSKLNIEKGKNNISIHYKSFPNINNFNYKGKFTADLFVHHNYYTESNKTKKHLFSGKFLELIYFSLNFDKNIDLLSLKDKEKYKINEKYEELFFKNKLSFNELKEMFFSKNLEINQDSSIIDNNLIEELSNCFNYQDLFDENDIDTMNRISYKIPFNSEFSKNKNFKKENEENEDLEDDNTNVIVKHSNDDLCKLLLEILIWKKIFITNIKLNSLSLYETMHKFFNNLAILKEKSDSKSFKDQDALTFIRRIVFIFINAVAYFENTNIRVADTNISVSDSFSLKAILKNANAYTQNIKPLLEKDSLTKALFYHPIISYIFNTNNSLDLLKFRSDVAITLKEAQDTLETYYEYNLKALSIKHKINLLTEILENCLDIEIKAFSKIEEFKNRFLTEHYNKATVEELKEFANLKKDFNNRIK